MAAPFAAHGSPMTQTEEAFPRGVDLLHHPRLNKGTAFTEDERDRLGLHGLLPPRVLTIDAQLARVRENLARMPDDLERYILLIALQDRNETLFYRTIIDGIDEMMPIIYTPTVGEACRQFGHIFRRSRGLYISADDRGRVASVLRNWPERDVRVIVVTDGERILGLGDLGANGMGIPIGKLSLYTACAGVDPQRCLPILLDVGTNNEELLHDPLYLGLLRKRITGPDYHDLVDEFVTAVGQVFPEALIQFEDFATANALQLLARYRDRACTFNDDVQGTAAVTLAGLYAAGRATGLSLVDQRILFFGAGSAAVGIADLVVSAMRREGLSEAEAVSRVWFVDSKGLVTAGRAALAAHKRRYAHDHAPIAELPAAVAAVGPTTLIGVSGQGQAFTRPALEELARKNPRPIVLALSNPTSKSECTAEQAYAWTGGRAVFASGSPFGPVSANGRRFVPRQGNNAYVFPGVGLGVLAAGATRVTDGMFFAAARVLASQTTERELAQGSLYPPLTAIRRVSRAIAEAVAHVAFEDGVTRGPPPADLGAAVRALVYEPEYRSY